MDKKAARERKKILFAIENLLEGPMIVLGLLWLVLLVIELVSGLTTMLEYLSLAV